MLVYALPFTLVPLVLYNLFGLGIAGAGGSAVWETTLFSVGLPSGQAMAVTSGALMTILGLVVLFVELVKSTRTTAPTIVDHGASMLVFILFLVEFIVVPACGTATFLILMLIALLDVVAGFTITIRGSRRDYAIDRDVSA